MSVLISAQGVTKEVATKTVFSNLSLTISASKCIGIIGPNGSGKSTLLKLLAGKEAPDGGSLSIKTGLRVAYVAQTDIFDPAENLQKVLWRATEHESDDDARHELIRKVVVEVGLTDLEKTVFSLSGGWRKRLAIALQLLKSPDLLLMDEPTNHLDLEGILWLESLINRGRFSSVIVTHDRYFLDNVARRIIEINHIYPSGYLSVDGDYATFLEKKAAFCASEAKLESSLANKMRREEQWLRRGPKARTTKARARIDAAEDLRSSLAELQHRRTTSTINLDLVGSERKTKKLLELKNVSKSLQGKLLFANISLILGPKTRLGIIGTNGSGKTTLLKIIAGQLAPDNGSVERAEALEIAYFDQHRAQLDPSITLGRALAPDSDSVVFRGSTLHIAAYAKMFLFRPEQLQTMVGKLSGGEQARVQIAKLMLTPADVLLLDEPTNDLDIQTLEVLEETLLSFPGGVVLVTHDRYMLDRVSTALLGIGETTGIFADFGQWQSAENERLAQREEIAKPSKNSDPVPSAPKRGRLTYMDQRDWDQIEERILSAEGDVERLRSELELPGIATDSQKLQDCYEKLAAAEATVAKLYARWAELEEKLKP